MATAFPSLSVPTSLTRKPDPIRIRASPSSTSSSPSWWAPLFGFPSDPDYIAKTGTEPVAEPSDPVGTRGGPRLAPGGGFTDEKARELRRKMRETASFHDAMYHSAIASRLSFVDDVSHP